MSVTIVSPPKLPAQPPAPDATGGGDSVASEDFANLLQGRLAADTADTPAVLLAAERLAALTAEAPATGSSSGDDVDEAALTSDASSLLATLALITPPVNSENPPAASSAEQRSDAALSALTASSAQAKAAPAAEQPESLKAAAAPIDTAASDEKAAKFAVAPIALDDHASTKEVSSEPLNELGATPHNIHADAPKHARSDTALSVPTPVRDQEWASDFGQKVVWLASSDKQSAQLTLNPAQMGPIEISLDIENGNASVSFASANAEVRDAIESALPRLREMFASAGIELGQTNVGAESSRQQAENGQQRPGSSRPTADNAILASDTAAALPTRGFLAQRGNGLVDLFA